MRPAQYNLSIYQYTDFQKSFTWKAGEPPVSVSLAGASARLMARVNHADRSPLISLSPTPNTQGVLLIEPDDDFGNPQTGKITVQINKATTGGLGLFQFPYWQLFVDQADGTTVTLVEGRIVIIPQDVH